MGAMGANERFEFGTWSQGSLRRELSIRAQNFATSHGLVYESVSDQVSAVIFGEDETGHHGNFHPASYERICDESDWAKRLRKVHTAAKRSRARANWNWKELDSANSSDALLMNIFCFPGVLMMSEVTDVLGIEAGLKPEFGFKPRTPFRGEKWDHTEIDMRIGELLVEAKLTESGFQHASIKLVDRYRDFEEIFDSAELPTLRDQISGYQLIRCALAAFATESSFCVLCDARRPDLIEAWFRVQRAVRSPTFRCRLKLLTWQQLASHLPRELQTFLQIKYGI
jgi:restriction endonuclease-like protein